MAYLWTWWFLQEVLHQEQCRSLCIRLPPPTAHQTPAGCTAVRVGLRQEREWGEGEERLTCRGLSQYIILLQAVNSFGVWLKRYFRALNTHTHTSTQILEFLSELLWRQNWLNVFTCKLNLKGFGYIMENWFIQKVKKYFVWGRGWYV